MPTYATRDDLETYNAGDVELPATDPALDALLEAAERDVDQAVGAHERDPDTGLKFTPADLAVADRTALRRATCAQAQYRALMGAEHFIRSQYSKVKGPEFETEGRLALIGPRVWQELETSDLLKLTTTFAGARSEPPWASFAYNLDYRADPLYG